MGKLNLTNWKNRSKIICNWLLEKIETPHEALLKKLREENKKLKDIEKRNQ